VPAESGDVTVVIPTFNERGNVDPIVRAVIRHGYQVLVVDDSSPDGTGELADGLAAELQGVHVLHRHHKDGLGRAYADGFDWALENAAKVVCEMDADFSHDPQALPLLLDALDAGADLAIGSRYVRGGSTPDWPLPRRLLSRGGNWYARRMLGFPVHDATAGFRAYRANTLKALDAGTCLASGYAFQVEMAWRAIRQGFRVTEVPITFRDRRVGQSKMGTRIVVEAMWLVTRWGIRRVFART
jgi:dolichol-phosphate mannosyltransferase